MFEEYKAKFDQAIKATPEYAAAQAILDDPELNEALKAVGVLLEKRCMEGYGLSGRKSFDNGEYQELPHKYGPAKIAKFIDYKYPDFVQKNYSDYPWDQGTISQLPQHVQQQRKTIDLTMIVDCDFEYRPKSVVRTPDFLGSFRLKLLFVQQGVGDNFSFVIGQPNVDRQSALSGKPISYLLDELAGLVVIGKNPSVDQIIRLSAALRTNLE